MVEITLLRRWRDLRLAREDNGETAAKEVKALFWRVTSVRVIVCSWVVRSIRLFDEAERDVRVGM